VVSQDEVARVLHDVVQDEVIERLFLFEHEGDPDGLCIKVLLDVVAEVLNCEESGGIFLGGDNDFWRGHLGKGLV
jgi:hypothetical protein